MKAEEQRSLMYLSALLRYPDGDILRFMRDCPKEPGLMPGIGDFVAVVGGTDMVTLQGHYVESFDMDVQGSLYLTAHVFTGGFKQGKAMAALYSLYSEAGFTPLSGEMPDYLPLMLEFLSVAPPWACAAVCGVFAHAVRDMSRHLAHKGSVYAPLVTSAGALLSDYTMQEM